MNRLKFWILFLFCVPPILQAQDVERCTVENREDDSDALRIEKIKSLLEEKVNQGRQTTDTLIIIPVAVHFKDLEEGDRACFEEMALSQMEVLNNYFNRTVDRTARWQNDSTFYPGVQMADLNVLFKLADKNHPSNVDHGLQDGDYAVTFGDAFLGSLSDIDWAGYLNIVCFESSNTGIGSYGSSPIFGDPSIGARLRVNQDNFGRGITCGDIQPTPPFDLGGIAAHEVGHFFGLDHTFTESCDTDDGVDDTPNQFNSTVGNPPVGSVSSCGETTLTMNFMDYTDDVGIYMFSGGQGEIMRNYIEMISSDFKKDVFLESTTSTASVYQQKFRILPNPVSDQLIISCKEEKCSEVVFLYNGNGTLLREIKLNSRFTEETIDVSDLNPGLYFIRVGHRAAMVQKFIKI